MHWGSSRISSHKSNQIPYHLHCQESVYIRHFGMARFQVLCVFNIYIILDMILYIYFQWILIFEINNLYFKQCPLCLSVCMLEKTRKPESTFFLIFLCGIYFKNGYPLKMCVWRWLISTTNKVHVKCESDFKVEVVMYH